VTVIAVTTGAASQDLSLCGFVSGVPGFPGNPDNDVASGSFGVDVFAPMGGNPTTNISTTGLLGRIVRFRAVTATVGFITGPTQASVTGSNAPSLTATGVNGTGCCDQLAPGEWVDLNISISTRWIGFIGSGSGYFIMRPSSTGGAGGG
jgi:hypothetical protein